MTHWKQNFNYAFTGAYELQPGEERTLTIKETKKEEVANTNGGKELCFVAYFSESNKPMILNKTNCKTISKLYGPFVENWVGKRITIKAEPVKAFGELVDALRVKNIKPAELKPVDYSQQIKMLQECQTIEDLATVYKSFTQTQQAATVSVKDECKAKFTTK
jgi:hypothetical protein